MAGLGIGMAKKRRNELFYSEHMCGMIRQPYGYTQQYTHTHIHKLTHLLSKHACELNNLREVRILNVIYAISWDIYIKFRDVAELLSVVCCCSELVSRFVLCILTPISVFSLVVDLIQLEFWVPFAKFFHIPNEIPERSQFFSSSTKPFSFCVLQLKIHRSAVFARKN